MKNLLPFLVALLWCAGSFAQTPVPMSAQPGLTYTENFADIANWTNGFAAGVGANRFGAVGILSTGTIPAATKTTTSTATFSTGVSGGVQKGTGNIVLLSTGTTDNSTSDAIDFFMDYTGVDAGTLSFDWAVVFNSTGNRTGSLKVYASVDGTTFTELTTAAVTSFVNNITLSGNVTNAALPASFNNSPTARLRFYYHNGTGGTTGSRPKISIDNLKVTATASTPCAAPTAQPTALSLTGITDVSIDGSFTPSTPAADEYLVVISNNAGLTSNPVNGTVYNPGDDLGDGTVISRGTATTFTATALSPTTHYYFFVFALNSVCAGGPLYLTANPLTADATTTAGVPPCAAPGGQPTNLVFGTTTSNSIQGSFTATTADEYIVVQSTASSLTATPTNGTVYVIGQALGNGTIVQSSNTTAFSSTGLIANTTYYYYVFSFNSQGCAGGPTYNIVTPLTGNTSTLPLPVCTTPSAQPTNLVLNATNTSISGNFSASISADSYLVIRSTSSTLSASPVDNTDYAPGTAFGGGIVVSNSSSLGFSATGLTPATTYYFFIFASNRNCTGGTKYLTAAPLTGNTTTTNAPVANVYFGTWHSHSDYSDGNKDNPGYTPGDDYLYAMSSQCLDYLGISEHNHFSSANNPGNQVANYHLGTAQANTFTSTHSNFIAMYGMEWGVISGGGHVVVYGDGMDELFGWETGAGVWGAGNNYDVFVAKSDYTGANGLFKTINDRSSLHTFATLAHPNTTDFNNLTGSGYNVVADNAIAGCAVESGPAFSVNTTYTDPPSPMSYLSYFKTLLSRGFHVGPTIDHDNHNTTFGRTTRGRTAVIAPSLSRTELVKAMSENHFYATQDCDTKVDFTINSKIMGTVFTDKNAPNISVVLTDPTTSLTSANILVMYGVPGSGIQPVQVSSGTGASLNFTDNNLLNNMTGYYYLDITNGASRIITSPIWYTRNDNIVVPVVLENFFAQKDGSRVKLTWNTQQELNSKYFIVERATDGQHWKDIATLNAAGTSSTPLNYLSYDVSPSMGVNYYRLKEIDRDGRMQYSDVRPVFFKENYAVTVAPNPATDYINVYCKNNGRQITIQLLDIRGVVLRSIRTADASTAIKATGLSKGLYFVKVTDSDQTSVVKVSVE